jgi:hypothetical protein
MCVGFAGAWQYSKGRPAGVSPPLLPGGLPPMTHCQVINHTPAGYALRQTDTTPASLRIGELVSLRVEGRLTLQLAVVRWFRNTLKGTALEFGCELLADRAEAARRPPRAARTRPWCRYRAARGHRGPGNAAAGRRARPASSSSSRRCRCIAGRASASPC